MKYKRCHILSVLLGPISSCTNLLFLMSGLLAVFVGYFFNSPSPSSNVCMYFFFLYALRMQKSLECKSSTLQYAKRSKFKKLSHFVTEENSSTFAQRRKVDYYQVLLYIAYKWEYYITAVQIVTCTRIVIIISYFLKTYRICLFK